MSTITPNNPQQQQYGYGYGGVYGANNNNNNNNPSYYPPNYGNHGYYQPTPPNNNYYLPPPSPPSPPPFYYNNIPYHPPMPYYYPYNNDYYYHYRRPRRPFNNNRGSSTTNHQQTNQVAPNSNTNTTSTIAAINNNNNTAATTVAPPLPTNNALPQRQQRQRSNNRNNQHKPHTTTSAFRRQQGRIQQQQQQQQNNNQIPVHQNPFDILATIDNDNNDENEFVQVVDDDDNKSYSLKSNNNNKKNKKNNTKKKDNKIPKTKHRSYLNINRFAQWLSTNSRTNEITKSTGNQCFVIEAAPIYNEWIRSDYELQVWQGYQKLGIEYKHWTKEVVNRTRTRNDDTCKIFIQKKIDHFETIINQANTKINNLQIKLAHYWSQIRNKRDVYITPASATITTTSAHHHPPSSTTTTTKDNNNDDIIPMAITETETIAETVAVTAAAAAAAPPATTTTTTTTTKTTITPNQSRIEVKNIERLLTDYIKEKIQHIKKIADIRLDIAKTEMEEYKKYKEFEQMATSTQLNIHEILQSKIKLWNTYNRNYHITSKRFQINLFPKFVGKTTYRFNFNESILEKEQIQARYDKMNSILKSFQKDGMEYYIETLAQDTEILKEKINRIIQGFPIEDSNQLPLTTYKSYLALREKRYALQLDQSIHFLEEYRVEDDINLIATKETIVPTTHIRPQFIYDNPQTAIRRRTIELTTLKRKIESRFFDRKSSASN
ncbi:hypothetical protein I4U23_005691 [Adineta vaga]|nr:hypothetical protein I4U23_005691 [Adineta vaga]